MILGMQTHLIIDVADFQAIRIECQQCKSCVYMQTQAEVNADHGLKYCPVCGMRFDAALAQNMGKLLALIRRISESTKISIQVSADAISSKQ